MSDCKILFTGDFWHSDFQNVISGFQVPTTIVPIEKIGSVGESVFDLVVIAQSRRGQYSTAQIENIQQMFPSIPVVGLFGSWCEGETRSGTPWPGVMRIFWHQWEGRFAEFAKQLEQHGVTDWHAPRTSSVGDRIANSKYDPTSGDSMRVAISAWTSEKHAMLDDAIQTFGWTSCWVERAVWNAETQTAVDAICIEADSWTTDLASRVKWIRNEVPNKPMVLVVSYPRQDELAAIMATGISEVVSKPFELKELQSAIIRAIEAQPDQRTVQTSGAGQSV